MFDLYHPPPAGCADYGWMIAARCCSDMGVRRRRRPRVPGVALLKSKLIVLYLVQFGMVAAAALANGEAALSATIPGLTYQSLG
jgi:hypothetical protein